MGQLPVKARLVQLIISGDEQTPLIKVSLYPERQGFSETQNLSCFISFSNQNIPQSISIIGIGRRVMSDVEFQTKVEQSLLHFLEDLLMMN